MRETQKKKSERKSTASAKIFEEPRQKHYGGVKLQELQMHVSLIVLRLQAHDTEGYALILVQH